MTGAIEYIHLPSIGSMEECRRVQKYIGPFVLALDAENKLDGYRVSVVKNDEDFNYHVLPDVCREITSGRYPYLYVSLQPKQGLDISGEIEFIDSDFRFFTYFDAS